MKKHILLLALITFSANAQLGGLVNKAKEKLSEKRSESKISKTMTTENQEMWFEYPYQGYDYTSPSPVRLSDIQKNEYNEIFSPFQHIRKKGEVGTMHYFKDYPELQPVVQPYNNNLKIEFFEALPSSGKEIMANSFTSHSHIYARISTNSSIKEVFDLDEENAVINLKINLYDDDSQKIRYNNNISCALFLSKEEANLKSLDVDILPHSMKYSVFKNKEGDSFYISPFPNMHDQLNFPRNGAYKVGVFIYAKQKDDWGNYKEGDGIMYCNSFDYDFSAKEVATIKSEFQTVFESKKNGIKYANKDLPEEWNSKSNAFTMGMTEQQISNLYVNSYSGGAKVLKVIKVYAHQSSGGWTVQKNEYGIPLYRYSNQFYTMFVKNIESNSCYYQRFSLRQQYNGGGTYDAVIGDITYDVNFTDCSKMK